MAIPEACSDQCEWRIVQERLPLVEHNEDLGVELVMCSTHLRLGIKASNEGGHNCTILDYSTLLDWVKHNLKKVSDLHAKAVRAGASQ